MVRVPTLDNQTRGLSPLQPARPQYTPSTGLQSIGAALGDVNEVAQQIRQQEQLKADQAAFMEADRILGENENSLLNDPTSGALNYRGKDALDITSKALDEFDLAASKAQQGLTSERQRRVFGEALQQRRQGVERTLQQHESRERESFYASEREAYKQSAQSAAITNFRDPVRIEQEIEKARSAIDQTPGLSAEQRATELAQRRSAVYGGVIDRYLANDEVGPAEQYYTSVRERVDGETATNIERAIRVAKDRQEAKRESGLSLARAELQDQVRDIESAFRLRLPVTQVPPESRFVSLYGERGRKMYEQTKLMADASIDAAALTQRSTADVARIAGGYTPTQVQGSAMRVEVAGIIQQQARIDLKERKDDPAGYLVRHSPSVRATWEDFSNGGDVSRYVTAVRGEQERLGLPAGDLLPDAYASSVAARITQAAPEGMAALIQSEADRWGNAWPQVYGQLVTKNLSPAAVAIGRGMEPGAAIRLANVAATPLDELRKGVETPSSDVKIEIDENMRGFMRTLDGVVGGDKTFASMRDAVELLTYSYLRKGSPLAEAANQAYSEVIGDHYAFHSVNGREFRVPVDYDIPGLEIGADRALNTVPMDQLLPPVPTSTGTTESAAADYRRAIQRRGYWVTSANRERGLALFLDGAPVLRKDGSVYEVTWNDLIKDVGATRYDIEQQETERMFREAEGLR